jgi:hypothetical protein
MQMTSQPLLIALSLALVAAQSIAGPASGERQRLPAEFSCDRVHVLPSTTEGEMVRFFTDTGGGTWIVAAAAERLGLATTVHGDGEQSASTVAFPEFAADAAIPPVDWHSDPRDEQFRGRLFVMPKVPSFLKSEGMLGQEWFGGRVWTFDYARGTLEVGGPGVGVGKHTVALGFPAGADGTRKTHFPSIRARIDGEELPFLLDTGATIQPSPAAAEAIGLPGAEGGCGTGFITTHVFERWRKAHPDWPVVEDADTMINGEPMIRVPEVTIAGHTVGPVWFTRRADKNFHEYMSSMMDTRVEGALGGSLFRYFRMTIDYPAAMARFDRLP